MAAPKISPKVAAVIDAAPPAARKALKQVRKLVYEAAKANPSAGEIEETLKWGQPSWLPKQHCVGTTVRAAPLKDDPGHIGVYFHCQTTMVRDIRERYGDVFAFEGNRALIIDTRKPLPADELRHCFGMALTYHVAKKAA